MADEDSLKEICNQLIILSRRKSARRVKFTRDAPCDWRPGTITDPTTQLPFTGGGEWEFIADCLEQGAKLEKIELKKPPGAFAYTFTAVGVAQVIYVKLQLGAGEVTGRSFHVSNPNWENQND